MVEHKKSSKTPWKGIHYSHTKDSFLPALYIAAVCSWLGACWPFTQCSLVNQNSPHTFPSAGEKSALQFSTVIHQQHRHSWLCYLSLSCGHFSSIQHRKETAAKWACVSFTCTSKQQQQPRRYVSLNACFNEMFFFYFLFFPPIW